MTIQTGIPASVRELAQRLGVPEQPTARMVRLTQKGRIRQDESKGWMYLKAIQSTNLTECALDWKARVQSFGIVTVRDALTATEGLLRVRAFGFLPIASLTGSSELTRSERIRYLAEIPWATDAILLNHSLIWSENKVGELCVATGEGEAIGRETFKLDSDGRIAEANCVDRPRSVAKQFVATAWRGFFSDYRKIEGRVIPFSGGASWFINGREQVYAEFELVDWELA